jgi:hypothetical protein
MSQAGIIDFIGTHPQIPTIFVANVGSAIPIANTIELLGAAVAAHGVPLQTVASGNTVDFNVQYASAAASSIAGNAGVASFNSTQFTVDANGFVSVTGGSFAEFFQVDAFTAPGTNPVAPNGSGIVTVTGGQVAAGTTANVIRTNSLAANTYTIEIQRSQAVASSTVGDNGVSHFSSSDFTVDANGFVQNILGSGKFPVTPFVVGPIGQAGYQTIQSGINAANLAGGGIVVVQPGTYTENLTLFNGCHVMGLTLADAGGGVIIVGVHTPPTTGGFVFNNVFLQSATHIFNSASAGSAHLIIANAAITVTNGYTFNLPNWTGKLETYDVNDRGSTNDGYINNTGGSEVAIFSAAVGAGSGNPMIVSGVASIFTCAVGCPIQFVTGSNAFLEFNVHTNSISLLNNSTGEIVGCEIDAQITMSSSAAWQISETTINTASNPAIAGSGAGTLTLGGITFVSGNNISATLTTAGSTGFLPTKMTDGQLLIGKTNSGAVAANLTSNAGTITITNGAGTLNIDLAGGSVGVDSFSPDSGTDPVTPTAGGLVNLKGTGSVTSVGSLNTVIYQLTGLTNHNVQIGAGTATLTQVAPSATSGIPLVSNGAAADPSFTTAVVAGGGTGDTSFTAYAPICGGTTTTGALQSASTGIGTSGFVLTSNGSSALPSFQVLPAASSFNQVVVQVFTTPGSGTYTPTTGMKYCTIEVVGGGGGGGGVATQGATQGIGAGGGGAGGYARITVAAATIGASKAYVVGGGGAGGTAGANTGTTGTTTSVGATIVQATGGAGGTGAPAALGVIGGGLGGVGSSGDFNANGAPGGAGIGAFVAGVVSLNMSGIGGSSLFGGGGTSVGTVGGASVAGVAGTNYGSGGSGASAGNSGTQQAGGNGSGGIIIITEYLSV